MSDIMNSNSKTCVVCYKNVDIYSIGMCEHPVCYECSTRMRVLCQQNECPICRQDLPKVVFTTEIKPFRHLKKGNLLDTRYNIYFDSLEVQEKFTELLAHYCSVCPEREVFSSFSSLKDHMRRKHELHYCDLCVENLKIFSFERRCYTRPDLVLHRKKGDVDDKSHKGHPICEFCDLRYMDNDELFRHLRRDHLYCHFCDADGLHQYYSSYDFLRDHFSKEHYLCEEGDCFNEQFTSVFRTDIDLKAHKASVHGKHLGKAAAKQARTLELEFTLAPRDTRNGNRRGGATMSVSNFSNPGTYTEYGITMTPKDYFPPEVAERGTTSTFGDDAVTFRQPDVQSTEEFPSLGGTSTPSVSNLNVSTKKGRGNLTIRSSLKSAPLAVTDENFPALGLEASSDNSSNSSKTLNLNVYSNKTSTSGGSQRPQSAAPNLSIHVNHKTDGSITTRVSGPNIRIRPTKLPMDSDFPALGNSDSSSSTATSSSNSYQWTKITCAKPNRVVSNQSKKVVSSATPSLSSNSKLVSSKSFSDAFPSLPKFTSKKQSNTNNSTSSSNLDQQTFSEINDTNPSISDAKNSSKKKKKKKVKQNDNFTNINELLKTTISTTATTTTTTTTANNSIVQNDNQPSGKLNNSKSLAVDNKQNNNISNKTPRKLTNLTDDYKRDVQKYDMNNGDSSATKSVANELPRKRSEIKIDNLNKNSNGIRKDDDFPALGKVSKSNPPPGFSATTQPPPGFAIKLNNMGLNNNNNNGGLTFTNSFGESYSILPEERNKKLLSYVPPPDFQSRNKNLVAKISEVLGQQESIEEFRYFSGLYRQGTCSAEDYYKRCRDDMGISSFTTIFPEMLVLLPDINKQKELFDLHKKEVNGKVKLLEACPTCGQIVKTGNDAKNHQTSHSLDSHFPALGQSTAQTFNSWSRKGT